MDALITRARHPDAQLAWISAIASLVGWVLVAALAGALWCGAMTPAPPAPWEPVGAVPLWDMAGLDAPVPRPASSGFFCADGMRGSGAPLWGAMPSLDIGAAWRRAEELEPPLPPTAPTLGSPVLLAGLGAVGWLGFGGVPALAFAWVWRTRSRRVRLTARRLEIGDECFLLESEREMARARARLEELDLEQDLDEPLARLQRRLVTATLPSAADRRALQALRV